MSGFVVTWGIARSELRLTRRLSRFWVFLSIASLAGILSYANFYFIHYFFSPNSASAAAANPRFFMAQFGVNFVLMFLLGIVFLGFDLRARDRRERIVEVLDALPISNLELILGRAIGLLLAAWIPLVVLVVLLAIAAALMGNPLELYSSLGTALFMALPGFTCAIGLVYLLTVLLRHRLAAAVASLAVLIASFFVSLWWIPIWAVPIADVTGGYSLPFPSDLVPSLIDLRGILQRLGYLVAGLGFLVLAAAFHPRRDDSRRSMQVTAGLAALLVAAGLVGFVVQQNRGSLALADAWLAAHKARGTDPAPDLLSLSGAVSIVPGRTLGVDVELRFKAPEGRSVQSVLFTLNPGMHVRSLAGESAQPLQFTHENGLLEIALPRSLGAGEEMSVALVADGIPDTRFAYLDATVDPMEKPAAEAQIFILGYDSLVFRRQHVSLLPGLRWLPAPGAEAGRDDPRTRPTDFYHVDLEVEVPQGWLVAGPGRRQEPRTAAAAGQARFRFAPDGFVPGVALVAGPYESLATEIDGVVLEALVHPKHRANFEFFADATGEIEDWLGTRLDEARQAGLSYPYDALTLVEVPAMLRGYGGGWRLDSTLVQPGMILLRETSFPTARFERLSRGFTEARDREGGIPRAKREALARFFENDVNGGNPFLAAARSFFGFQTAGRGAEGVPLDWVCEELSSQVLAEKTGYFSVHFFDRDFGNDFQNAAMAMRDEDRFADDYATVLIRSLVSKPETWDMALGLSLAALDPWENPARTVDLLSLKGGAMARSLLDALGREKAARFLAALRRSTAGGAFTRQDVIAAGQEVGEDLAPWIDVWIDETGLPGFTVGEVRYQRIPDAADGAPRYQVTVVVRNEEAPSGLLRLEYRMEGEGEGQQRREREKSEPVLVRGRSAVEVGLTTSAPVRSLRVAPYFSLNRDPFSVQLPALDAETIVNAEGFSGSRVLDWTPSAAEAIVVDDLDGGFGLDESQGTGMLRVAGRGGSDVQLDQGLPVGQGMQPARWSRVASPQAFGKYRRTMVVVRAGEGKRRAVFTVELPRAGSWQLEYHLPQRPASGKTSRHPGKWNLTVAEGGADHEVRFDADSGEAGWNALGTFDVAAGEVRVTVSDSTDGDYVVADAIRWVPLPDVASRLAS